MKKFLIAFILTALVCYADEPMPESNPEQPPLINYVKAGHDQFGGKYIDFGFNSRPRRTYDILVSNDLNNWILYGNVTADDTYTIARVHCMQGRLFVRLRYLNTIIFPQ